MKTSLGITFLLGTTLLACTTSGTTTPTPGADPLAGENGDDGDKADGNGQDTFGIYTALKVGAFECNGLGSCTHVTLGRANRSTTTCADGSTAATCDVRYLDFTTLGLSSTKLDAAQASLQDSANEPQYGAQLLVRGDYVHGTNPTYPGVDWVTFQVTELWVSQVGQGSLDGTFVMMKDAPKSMLNEARLNSNRSTDISGIDWGEQGDSDLASTVADLTDTQDAVVIVGNRSTQTDDHVTDDLRTVNQVFLRSK